MNETVAKAISVGESGLNIVHNLLKDAISGRATRDIIITDYLIGEIANSFRTS